MIVLNRLLLNMHTTQSVQDNVVNYKYYEHISVRYQACIYILLLYSYN